jgi:FkbM family methyltransferase
LTDIDPVKLNKALRQSPVIQWAGEKKQKPGRADDAQIARRRAYFDDASAFTPLLAVRGPNRATFLVSTQDRRFGRLLFAKHHRSEISTLRKAVLALREHQPDNPLATTFLDVGAHIGTCTIAALLGHGFQRSVAIEPSPENHTLLRANAVLNGVDDRIEALDLAVSDDSGPARLELRRFDSGANSLVDVAEDAEIGKDRRVDVERTTLDRLVERAVFSVEEVGLASIDVGGDGLGVLRGGDSLLRAGVPLLMRVEWEPGGLAGLSEVLGENYTQFVDLVTGDPDTPPRSISELASMSEETHSEDKGAPTALLLLRRR